MSDLVAPLVFAFRGIREFCATALVSVVGDSARAVCIGASAVLGQEHRGRRFIESRCRPVLPADGGG